MFENQILTMQDVRFCAVMKVHIVFCCVLHAYWYRYQHFRGTYCFSSQANTMGKIFLEKLVVAQL
jgi:hypothetical protein